MLLTLPDGAQILVRPIAPVDKPLLQDGVARLSIQTAHRRFLSPKPRLTGAELRYLTEVDGRDHIALVAVDANDPRGLVAVARCVRWADRPDSAEMAIVVGDCWHRRGIGTALAAVLVEEAADVGVRRFTATMLADNRPALRLMRRLGPLELGPIAGGVREVVTVVAAPAPAALAA